MIKLRVAGKEQLKIRRRDLFERVRQQTIAASDENALHVPAKSRARPAARPSIAGGH